MRTRMTFTLVFGAAFVMAAGADAYERCEPFSTFTKRADHKHAYFDHGDDGPSVGDRRIAYSPLRDAAGEPIGHLDAEVTVVHPGPDGELRTAYDFILQFPTGVILYKIVPHSPRRAVDDVSGTTTQLDATRIIVGGSGVFAGASGSVEIIRDDVDSEIILSVSCE